MSIHLKIESKRDFNPIEMAMFTDHPADFVKGYYNNFEFMYGDEYK